MKWIFVVLVSIFAGSLNADSISKLPNPPDLEKLNFAPVGQKKEIYIDANILLPKGHKLNPAAKSAIDVYEQLEDKKWNKIKTIRLYNSFTSSNRIWIEEKVKLTSSSSKIAVDSTLYHCSKEKKSYCIIDSFQGVVGRKASLVSKVVKLDLKGNTLETKN